MPKQQHAEQTLARERGTQDVRMQDEGDSSFALRSEALEVNDGLMYQVENLVAPPARPGYVQRWIRVADAGQDDFGNVHRAMHAGWRPRKLDTVDAGHSAPSIKHGEWAGVIGSRDMVLCERSVEIDAAHKAAIEARTKMQTRAITGELEQIEHKQMPFEVDIRSRVTRGNGRRPPAMSDADSET